MQAYSIAPWFLAARPKTLTAAIVPVLVGTFLAPTINWWITFYAICAALFVQIGTNLFNDALDFKKGADNANRIGPMRVTQMGLLSAEQVMAAGLICLLISLICGIPLIERGGLIIVPIALASVLCAYLYTGGPYPLAYVGLGEVFVMIFFGWVSTTTVYFLQAGEWNLFSLLAGTQIGFLSVALIAINNLRDCDQDFLANKRTLAVRFGKESAKVLIVCFLMAPYLLSILWGKTPAGLIPWVTFPLACFIGIRVNKISPGPIYNYYLGLTALLHLLFGLFLSLGFYFS
jgi:1,4-dihydroxy-2-naphthoate octaprenyltransferase